jgi:hypothetical protein
MAKGLDTVMRLPLRSEGAVTGRSGRTSRHRSSGESETSATARTGAPLKIMAMSGPVLNAMSMLPAVSACTSRVPPVNALISRSSPCFLKMPARTPTSSSAKVNAPATGLPKRTTSAPAAGASRPDSAQESVHASKLRSTTGGAPGARLRTWLIGISLGRRARNTGLRW